jgi:metal-responsive CopG/Arc/MetJ family transcriptional regulator
MAETPSKTLSVALPLDLYRKSEKTAKDRGFENLSQFIRNLLRQATK